MKISHSMPFGAELRAGGARFSLWSPTARRVEAVLDGGDTLEMPIDRNGWAEGFAAGVGAGARYSFRIDGHTLVPDPASRFQPDGPLAPSQVVDPRAFAWRDRAWRGRPWEEAVLWEAHVGAATPGGAYADLVERLPYLAELGVTALELMPISDCPGARNWGYDGVLPFAPYHAYGRPDDLKNLVAQAHAAGIMMILDVVYNHFGPSGNFLHAYAKSFFDETRATPWGAAIDFDPQKKRTVREFFIHNALYWLEEYRFDGLRFDAVHAISDDGEPPFLNELAERVRLSFPERHIHLVLENEKNEARRLQRSETRSQWYTAQWNDDLHHCWHRLLTGESEGYYEDFDDPTRRLSRALAEGFVYQGEPSKHKGGEARGEPSAQLEPVSFVAFLQNHDQIGNRAFGERLSDLADPRRLQLATAALLLGPQIPMLFMGEEWNASSPFLFFVDFAENPELSKAVRDGRRQEFSRFAAFAEPERIPDPTAEETFRRSKLNWDERQSEPHASALAFVGELLRIRKAYIVPLLKSGFADASSRGLGLSQVDTTWRFAGGALRFVANFGEAPNIIRRKFGEQPIWTSEQVDVASEEIRLPDWTGVFTVRTPDV